MTTATIESPRTSPRRSAREDGELARAAGRGDVAAFEALYERHHRALLSFARHMLGRLHDAEDVVQHTFAAADATFREGRTPASVRAWLYTVARNRCLSILRARRDDQALPEPGVPSAENLAAEVEQREDLRELLADLRTLPDDQRAALLLSELGELSHAEVGQVLGVRARKVKALVYQARQALLAAAGARAIPCRSIREELAVANGAARRRRHLRDHVARCEGCRAYAASVARQRASIAAILPVVPTVALRDAVLACAGGGGAAAVTATGGASAGLGVLGAKLLAIAALGGAAAGGGTVAVDKLDRSEREPRAARSAAPARPPAAPAVAVSTAPAAAPSVSRAAPERASRAAPASGRREAARRRADRAPRRTAARAAPARPAKRRGDKPETAPGLARGHAKQQARRESAAGKATVRPERVPAQSHAPPEPAGRPAAKPVPPSRSRTPAQAAVLPPGQAQPKAKALKQPAETVKAK
jgi:RNA polymerase sigma factor (sigma-70 family)